MSIHLGEECVPECLEKLAKPVREQKSVLLRDAREMAEDAAKVCSNSRSPAHICSEVFALLQKWAMYGAGQ